MTIHGIIDTESFQSFGATGVLGSTTIAKMSARGLNVGGVSLLPGPYGGSNLQLQSNGGYLNDGHYCTGKGFWCQISSPPSGFFEIARILPFTNVGGTVLFAVYVGADGTLQVQDLFTGRVGVGAYIADDVWHHIEMSLTFISTNHPHFRVAVDGVTVYDRDQVSGVILSGGQSSFTLGPSLSGSVYVGISDLFWTGPTDAAPFVGPSQVLYRPATGAGTHSDFTAVPSGANYSRIVDTPEDDLTSYVYSNVLGAKDSYSIAALPSSGSIIALKAAAYGDKDKVNPRGAAILVRSSGVEAQGPDTTLNTNGATNFDPVNISGLWETDPATGASWANGATPEIGITVSS